MRYCELGELVKANRLKFYRPFDLHCVYGSDDGEYIVPSFVLVYLLHLLKIKFQTDKLAFLIIIKIVLFCFT